MLHRAANNAYSWWWASHIRTKQSKWLEQSLQDMEDKVQYVMKLIEEDGDSFARRAEMYYKKRPELIHFVEDSYRAYRALAERYDHISTELQNANTTIASVFPEQVQFAMDEEDEAATPRFPRRPPEGLKMNIPKVPKTPARDLKSVMTTSAKKLQQNKKNTPVSDAVVSKSGLSKPEAVGKINKLQKEILGLQTEKEFFKSSYESGLAKCWEIDNRIKGMQEQICSLQDEFGVGMVIEDEEARKLMAETALKSCQETLDWLHKKHQISAEEAKVERKRIEDVREKVQSLKNEFPHDIINNQNIHAEDESAIKGLSISIGHEKGTVTREKHEMELLREKIKEHLEVGSDASITVSEMAEKIDEIVNKVISLESEVSSQNALMGRLRAETDELQAQIRLLDEEKVAVRGGANNTSNELMIIDEKLHGIQDLNQSIEDWNSNLQTHFIEAHCNIDHVAEKLQIELPGEVTVTSQKVEAQEAATKNGDGFEEMQAVKADDQFPVGEKISKKEEDMLNPVTGFVEDRDTGGNQAEVNEEVDSQTSSQKLNSDLHSEPLNQGTGVGAEPNWRELFMKGMGGKEKLILAEYTTVLRNYKEVQKKLGELENNNQDNLLETVHLQELKSANIMKDEEIQSLRQHLNILQTSLDGEKYIKENKSSDLLDTSSHKYLLHVFAEQHQTMSEIEIKFRGNIDELLEENLDFWLRFSTSFHEVQKFETEIADLQSEVSKLEDERKNEGSKYSLRSDVRPIYKHLREKQTELTIWMEQSAKLKEELQHRFSSQCNIQEDITKALKESAEDDNFTFTSYQAAKFQGEILNMKQENNKVADELQAALDHVTTLQIGIDKTLGKLNDEFKLSASKNSSPIGLTHSETRSRVPLRSFIFGNKQKSQRPSFFSCVSPAIQRYKHRGSRSGASPI